MLKALTLRALVVRNTVAGLVDRFRRDEHGATMVEYGLMVALIAVVCIGTISAVGVTLDGLFGTVDTELQTASGS